MPKILIIDDERPIRSTLRDILTMEKYKVEEAADGVEAIEKVRKEQFDMIFCDIKMPRMDGHETFMQIKDISPDTPVVMISGHGDIDTAVEFIKLGAYDYIAKPLDLNRILTTIRNGLDKLSLVKETKQLKKKISKKFDIIGDSDAINGIKDMIERVAPTAARVLITGSNGTGKELVARWLHEKSDRMNFPFVEVNCASIPSELIESELFGHVKGAFTSAIKDKKGKFEQAEGGTLFLDEIGDMSLSAQAKVLRALQENKITPVGAERDILVNVRIVAATNKNMGLEVAEGRFREDLYHRISVILIHVPSLNDRIEDIPILISHFMENICTEYGIPVKHINETAIKELQKLSWTGNIRELRNVVERLIILCGDNITDEDVAKYVRPLKS